jgi:peptidyl-prolyl cis-trans isomerase B (cyclophilin B)
MSNPLALLETTSGDILIELFHDDAPTSVANFLAYVDDGFYENTIFHRVIKSFMIQGGGLDIRMNEKDAYEPIPNEAANGLKNVRGSVAMARTSEIHSATSQFFINTADNSFLDHSGEDPQDYGYAVFGKVVEGMDVVDKIEKAKTTSIQGHDDVPADSILITGCARFE